MRVLLFSSMPHDLNTGSPIRGRSIRQGMIELGVDVAVVSPLLEPASRKGGEYNLHDYTSVQEALNSLIDSFAPDIIYCITHGFLDIVSRVAKKRNVPFAVDLHGIRSLELFSEQHSPMQFIRLFQNAIAWEKSLFNARLITAANPMLYKWVSKILPQVRPVIGMADDSFFCHQKKTDSGKLRILYSGNMAKYQGIDIFLSALGMLDSSILKKVDAVVIGTIGGNGAIRDALATAEERGLARVAPPVGHSEFSRLLSQFDAAVIPRRASLATYLAFPQKLVEFMSAGVYVIASDIAPHCYAITHGLNGYLCKATPENFARAIVACLEDKSRKSIAENARDYAVQHFSRKAQSERIVNYLHDAVCGKYIRA